jgi:hypothetical protein
MNVWEENPALEGRLRQLVAESKSSNQIARELKLTRNQVIGKCARLGLQLTGEAAAHVEGKRRLRKEKTLLPVVREERAFREPSPPRRFSFQDHV